MNIRNLLFGFILALPVSLHAQYSPQPSSSEIKLALQKLNTVGSVLYMAAHPDDENTRLLSYLAKERKLRTGYLSLTRGDGGQNLIGTEQGELLGLIRTQELLAARRTDGAEQFFSRAIDFGYSKTSEETFRIWGKEQILADAVWVIRNFRPDVIITRFPEDSRAGHGQHAASAIIAREAFAAAADPRRFPDQLKFVQPWQAKRLVWNNYNFGGTNTTSDDQLKINVGVFNPLLGKGYGEIAAESRTNHKSQGFGSARQRGQSVEYFTTVAGEPAINDLFEGIDQSWNRVKGSVGLAKLIRQADTNFQMDKPSGSVPLLINVLKELKKLQDPYWKAQKEKETTDLIAAAAGLWFEAGAAAPVQAIHQTVAVTAQAILNSDLKVSFAAGQAAGQNSDFKVLEKGVLVSESDSLKALKLSQPYWLNKKSSIGNYAIADQQLVGFPEDPDKLSVWFNFMIEGYPVSFRRPVIFKSTDQVRGEVYQPLVIAPPVTATITENAYVFNENTPRSIQVQLKSFRDNASGALEPQVPAGWKISPARIDFNLIKKGDERAVSFTLTPGGNVNSGHIAMHIKLDGQTFDRGLKVVSYDHIPLQTLFPLSESRVERLKVITDGKKIGYLAGAGDMIPESLTQLGYEVTIINENQILNGDLSKYDAIIAGIRAYNVNSRLRYIQPKLMEYVENGGTYLVQYNVSNPLVMEDIGPYPFKISRDRVTEEDANVSVLAADNPVLNYPNKITADDFQGWVQERGIYFLSDMDKKYTPLLAMSDKNEKQSNGSLIVTDYGKGRFIYTSLVFFRQLPAGVPGAYRLFVNLIANKNNK
ncbi:PIG-L family deacetylase [Flavihumibacter sp. R14]|nr:PIG-L family deacetylase [Flavihumibacter soli]